VILGEINEMFLSVAQKEKNLHNDDDQGDVGNSGTMLVDATCAPANMLSPRCSIR